jgi:(E)-4-hydroxy-3-methylbut-2-enyl-diphosphate synthase
VPSLRAAGLRRDPHGRGARSRLQHIKTPLSLSVLGCVVNGPAKRARPTSASPAAANGKHMVYLSGVTDHHVTSEAMLDHIVALVEAKAAEIEAETHRCRTSRRGR